MGRKCTAESLRKLEKAIAQEFSSREHKDLYPKSGKQQYNFAKLKNLLDLRGCDLSRPTLDKIFKREEGVSLTSLEKLFEALQVSFDEKTDCEKIENNPEFTFSELGLPISRADLSYRFCNIPQRDYAEFIGREKEMSELLNLLSHDARQYVVTIDGIGGLGKTTLAKEASHLCWEKKHGRVECNYGVEIPDYDAIIWTSYKTETLDPLEGIISISGRNLEDFDYLEEIYTNISDYLEFQSIQDELDPDQKRRLVYRCLAQQKTLLILDDLNFPEQDEKIKVYSFLENLPQGTKAIITTRIRRTAYANIRLDRLSEEEGIRLIEQKLSHRNRNINEISLDQKKSLYECFGGIPLALKLVIAQYDMGYSIESLLGDNCPIENISQYCFDNVIQHLSYEYSLRLLRAISLFKVAPRYSSAIYVADLEDKSSKYIGDALNELNRADLLREENGHCVLLSVTREYVEATCRKDEQENSFLLNRRLQWCIKLVNEYGGIDWLDWRNKYDYIEEEWGNILEILRWCASHKKYEDVKMIWSKVNHFADLYGKTHDRIKWLNWLIDESKDQGDRETYTLSMGRKMWTLTMTGEEDNINAAKKIMEEVLAAADVDELRRDYLLHNAIVLLTRYGDLRQAEDFLVEKKKLMRGITEKAFEENSLDLKRRQINTIRDEAKINLINNRLYLSRQQYEQVLEESIQIGWKRMACYARNILADIAILENRLDDAEKYLEDGAPTHIYNHNRRRRAFYTKTDAYLKQKRGQFDEARKLAKEALALFGEINMEKERRELSQDLASWENL